MPNILRKENRQYTRVKARLPLTIISSGGETLQATSLDLSFDGIQVECDHQTHQQIILDNAKKNSGQPVEVTVQIEVPSSKNSENLIEIRCRMVISRRLAQDTYHLGLTYLDFEDTEDLEKILDSQLARSA